MPISAQSPRNCFPGHPSKKDMLHTTTIPTSFTARYPLCTTLGSLVLGMLADCVFPLQVGFFPLCRQHQGLDHPADFLLGSQPDETVSIPRDIKTACQFLFDQ